jgi:homoserine kinase type II
VGDSGVLNPDALDAAALAAIGDAYDVGTISGHWAGQREGDGQTFYLTARRGSVEREYVLTVMPHRAAAGDLLAPLLEACAAKGFPVAAPLRQRDGTVPLTFAGRRVTLYPRLPGRHVLVPTRAQVASVGRFLARLHRDLAAEFELPPHPRTLDLLEAQARGCLPHLPYVYQRELQDGLREVRSLLARSDRPELPTGTIHGNLSRDNVLFDRWGLAGVLDFQHAAHGILLYDVAAAANDWCVGADGAIERARLDALIDSYAAIRPFTAHELRHLPAFMLYATLACWLARLTVAIGRAPHPLDRAKDLEGFARIVALRREQPVHVDAWRIAQAQDPGREAD